MKLPLVIIKNALDMLVGIYDSNGRLYSRSDLVEYINSHATQPGAPREDGVWDVKLRDGRELVVQRNMGAYYVGDPCYVPGMESQIVCHRKHQPLEVPK